MFKSFHLALIVHLGILGLYSLSSSFKSREEKKESRGIALSYVTFTGGGAAIETSAQKKWQAPAQSQKGTSQGAYKETGHGTSTGASSSSGSGSASGSAVNGSEFGFGESVVNYSEPQYPRLAIKRQMQGVVKLKIKVSAEGLPVETTLIKSSGHELLDSAAMEAIRKWVFRKKDVSDFYLVEKTIIFELKNS